MSRNFLIPHDFTPVGDSAVKQGVYLAKATQAAVCLLHIVKSDKLKAEAETKLKAIKAKLGQEHPDLTVKLYVVTGDIFVDIGKTAETLKSSLIIMGTHGAKGMQKVFGSFAMKVITSTSVPFLVVQNDSIIKKLERIIFPLGIQAETLQIMGFAANLAKAFGAEVHLIAEKQTDVKFANKTKINFQVVGKQLKSNDVAFVMEYLPETGSYVGKILEYTQKVKGDIIAVSYYNEAMIPAFDRFAQNIITNDLNIPSLIINSKSVSSPYF
ncbi:MAG: universal stress protein [Flavobacteriales bacterium]|nr:universal stress protein [Flavobacteriales bacterium]